MKTSTVLINSRAGAQSSDLAAALKSTLLGMLVSKHIKQGVNVGRASMLRLANDASVLGVMVMNKCGCP